MIHVFLQRQGIPVFLLFFLEFLEAPALDDQHEFAPGRFFLIIGNCAGNGGNKNSFIFLGKLPADGNAAIAQGFVQFFQSFQQVVGSFVENYGAGFLLQRSKYLFTFFFLPGQKGFECKTSGRKAGHG